MGIDIWENMLKNSNTKLLICSNEETLKKIGGYTIDH